MMPEGRSRSQRYTITRLGPLAQLLLILGVGILLLWNFALGYLMTVRLHMNDFGKFYYSTRLFLDGQDMYGPNPATTLPVTDSETREFLNLNPPHAHVPLLPLALLSPLAALGVWSLASGVCLARSIGLIAKNTNLSVTSVHPLLAAFAFLAFAGTQTVMVTGQLSFILMLPVTLAWIAARRGDWSRAGFYLGLLISIKLFFLIFVPYLWLRARARPVIVAAATAMGCFSVGLLIFGVEAHRSWLRALGAIDWLWVAMNASLPGLLSRALSPSPHFTPLAIAPEAIHTLSMIGAVVIGLLSYLVVLADRTEESVDRSFALLMITALLVSPLGWLYYVWFVLGPAVAVLAWGGSAARGGAFLRRVQIGLIWVAGMVSVIPEVVVRSFQPSSFLTVTLGSAYFWGMAALWAALLVHFCRRAHRVAVPWRALYGRNDAAPAI
jgi:Glycosyltransferase family 87